MGMLFIDDPPAGVFKAYSHLYLAYLATVFGWYY